MAVEYELKFAADSAQFQALKDQFGKNAHPFAMHTQYYDTPTLELSQRRYTLRKRMENDTSICTLKTPAALGRNEWEVECGAIEAAIPMLCKLGAPTELPDLAAQGLQSICGAKFHRLAVPLAQDGFCAELALDEGVLTGGGRELPILEVELEYKGGDITLFQAFAEAFSHQYELEIQPLSKFRRALNLYKGV